MRLAVVTFMGGLQGFLAVYFIPRVITGSGILGRFGVARPTTGVRLFYLLIVPIGYALLWAQDLRLFRAVGAASPVLLTAIVHLTALGAALVIIQRVRWWPLAGGVVAPVAVVVITATVSAAAYAVLRLGVPGWLVAVLAVMLVAAGDALVRAVAPAWIRQRIERRALRALPRFTGDLYGLDPAVWRLVEADGDTEKFQLLYHRRVPAPAPAVIVTCGIDPDRGQPLDRFSRSLGPPPPELPLIQGDVRDTTEPAGLPSILAYSGPRTVLLVSCIPPAPAPGFGPAHLLADLRPLRRDQVLAALRAGR